MTHSGNKGSRRGRERSTQWPNIDLIPTQTCEQEGPRSQILLLKIEMEKGNRNIVSATQRLDFFCMEGIHKLLLIRKDEVGVDKVSVPVEI